MLYDCLCLGLTEEPGAGPDPPWTQRYLKIWELSGREHYSWVCCLVRRDDIIVNHGAGSVHNPCIWLNPALTAFRKAGREKWRAAK